ncbi:PIN domain-containing protein [Alysiella filiformis]|uniref:PIN domain-containing protein n=1 Tax=Alysiella filiformis DSM 16848 TaxID=1120981 RepID=A0A286EED9_9NEIS|nr:PIN domain-containing protein [Alysiella filiformis]SOD69276.1 PIN domain-containing protein [Alysiella filiformis DSM 16848]
MSSIVLSELLYGAEKSDTPTKSLALIESLAARLEVLDFDENAAAHSAEIRAELAKKAHPLGIMMC